MDDIIESISIRRLGIGITLLSVLVAIMLLYIREPLSIVTTIIFLSLIAIFFATTIKPIIGLYGVILAITITGGRGLINIGEFWAQTSELVVIIVGLGWLVYSFARDKVDVVFDGLAKYLLILLITLIPGAIKGYTAGNGLPYILFEISLYLRYSITGILTFNIIEDIECFKRALFLFLTCGFIVSVFSLFTYYVSPSESLILPESGFEGYGRVASTFGNPNSFAGFLELLIPILISLYFNYKGFRSRMLILASIVVSTWALFLTYSRGGFIALLLALIIILIMSPLRARNKIFSTTLISVLIILVFISGAQIRQRSALTGQSFKEELEYGRRGEQYRVYLELARKNIIDGIGFGYMQDGYYFVAQKHGKFVLSGLNSYFLDLMTKGGLLAICGFALLLMAIAKRLINNLGREKDIVYYVSLGISAGLAGHFFHQIFDNLLKWPAGGMVFWFLVGLVLAGVKVVNGFDSSK
jgi:putative inorganic carbon (HCO3(-)) transporter